MCCFGLSKLLHFLFVCDIKHHIKLKKLDHATLVLQRRYCVLGWNPAPVTVCRSKVVRSQKQLWRLKNFFRAFMPPTLVFSSSILRRVTNKNVFWDSSLDADDFVKTIFRQSEMSNSRVQSCTKSAPKMTKRLWWSNNYNSGT